MKTPVKLGTISAKVRQRAKLLFPIVTAVLLLMTAVIGGIYSSFQKIALSSLAQQDAEFARQIDALGNFTQNVIQQYGLQIFYDPVVAGLLEETDTGRMEQVYDLRTLNAYDRSRSFLDSIFIYNKDKNYIYSTDGRLLSAEKEEFADRSAVWLFEHLDADERMMPIRRVAFPGEENERRYFSFLFYETTYMDEPEGSVLMLNVDERWYLDNLTRFYGSDGCILTDEHGMILTAVGPELAEQWALFQPEILAESDAESRYLLKSYKGRDLVCLYSQVETNGWYCVRLMPMEKCLPGLVSLRNGLALGIGVSFLLLLLGIAITMIYLYLPVLKLKKALHTPGGKQPNTSAQIDRLVRESNEYQGAHALRDILENRPATLKAPLTPPLTLLLLEDGQLDRVKQVIREKAPKSLLDRQHHCDVLLLTGPAALQGEEICGALAEKAGCRCFCGSPRTGMEQLPECYQTLLELRLQKFWYAQSRVIMERDCCCTKPLADATREKPGEILTALKNRNPEEAQALWAQLLEELRGTNHLEQLVIFHKLAELMEGVLPELKPLVSDEFFLHLEDVSALNERYCGAFARIAEHYQQQKMEHYAQIVHKAVTLLDRDYADAGLSLAGVADRLDMSSAYLGRIFKETMHCSVSQYLNTVRMEHAKARLLDTEDSVERIAEQVGFSNVKYFYVVFKNICGMTPLQYRKGKPQTPS